MHIYVEFSFIDSNGRRSTTMQVNDCCVVVLYASDQPYYYFKTESHIVSLSRVEHGWSTVNKL